MVFRSVLPDIEVPPTSLPAFVLEHAGAFGDKPALIDGPSGRTITYAQLGGMTRALGSGLASRGFGPGDVFAIFSPNVPEYAVAFHGVLAAGGANTTINSLASAEDIEKQLRATRARFLLTIPQFLDRALPAAGRPASRRSSCWAKLPKALRRSRHCSRRERRRSPSTSTAPRRSRRCRCRSGTTGFAKVVQLTHRNLVANVLQSDAAIEIRPDDVMIGVLPFFHIYGMTVLVNLALRKGATVVTMPRFDLDEFLRLMEEHRVTFACLVPPIVLALAKHPAVDKHDLSALERVMSGAAPLDASVCEAAAARLDCIVLQGYGLTETSPVMSAPTRDPSQGRPASSGFILPNTEIRVANLETGEDCAADEDGEIWIRGPQVMKGYLDDPEADAYTMPGDGWLRTGDIGHADADGYLYRGRPAEGAHQVPGLPGAARPSSRRCLVQHPAVADAAVIPSPDDTAGEVPKAFVVQARRRRGHGGRADVVGVGARPLLQEGAPRRVHRRDPAVAVRQDPAPRPGRARARCELGGVREQVEPPHVALHEVSGGYSNSRASSSVKPSLRQIAFDGGLSTDGYAYMKRCVRSARWPRR